MLSDLHIGQQINKDYVAGKNKYNYDIAKTRMSNIMSQVPTKKKEDLHTFVLGDLIHGNLPHHQDYDKTMEFDVIEQTVKAKVLLLKVFKSLSKKYKTVYVYNAIGNHARMPNKKQMPNVDFNNNFDWLILDMITSDLKLMGIKNVKIKNNEDVLNITKLGEATIAYTHGDQILRSTSYANVGNAFRDAVSYSQEMINFIFSGHFHHSIITQSGTGQFYVMCGSLCGTDPYALNSLKKGCLATQMMLKIQGTRILESKLLYAENV